MRQVEQGRQPRTDATVARMLERYLAEWDGSESFRRSLLSYVRNHVNPFVGEIKARQLDLDVLDAYYGN